MLQVTYEGQEVFGLWENAENLDCGYRSAHKRLGCFSVLSHDLLAKGTKILIPLADHEKSLGK